LCLYVHNLSSKGVTWSSYKISSFLLWLRRVYRAFHRIYITFAFLCGEILSLSLIKEHRLNMSENWRREKITYFGSLILLRFLGNLDYIASMIG
jgi:hypothetical protein